MASRKKKNKLPTVAQYEESKGLGRNGLPTVDTYEKRLNERRQEEARQRLLLEQEKKRQIREASFNDTKDWYQRFKDAQNSQNGDQSWQVYAAKQMLDTPGALEKEQERQREVNRRNNLLIQSSFGTPAAYQPKNALTEKLGQYKTQQSALNNYLKDLNKRKSTMSGLPWDGPVVEPVQAAKQYEKNQQQKWEQALEELYAKNRQVNGSGHDTWEANKEEIGDNLSIGSFNSAIANRMGERERGTYDIGSNPIYMSNSGLNNNINNYFRQADNLRKQAEEYRLKGYSGLFDYIEGLDRANEETITRGNYTPEEQATALRTLRELNNTYEDRRGTAIKNAEREINGYKKYGADMFDKTISNQTKDWLYYLLTGDDYAKRTANMTEAQKAELDQKIEEARESIRNYSKEEYDSMIREADAYEDIAKQALGERATRGKISDFISESRRYDSAAYDPSLVEMEDIMLNGSTEVLTVKGPKGSREDKAFYYMNNIPEEGKYGNTFGLDQKEYFALPEWVDAYNAFYMHDKEYGTNQAGAFLDAIDPYLTSWKSEYDDFNIRKMSENPITGIPMRIMSYPLNAANSLSSIINTGLALLGNKYASDPNNPVNQINKLTSTTREEQNKDIDTALGGTGAVEYVLGIADSIGDNLTAMGAGGLVTGGNVSSKAGMAVVQLIMSGEATGHTFLEKLKDNTDPTEAALYAIGDGVIEWFTEKVSLEALLNPDVKSMLGNTKQLMKYFGKVSLAEGSEEIASDLLNWGLDYILSMAFDHETELRERYLELIGSGMRDQEATRQALLEKFEQIGMSGLAGAISGGLMGMGRAGINYIGNLQAGSQINDAKNIDKMVDIGLRADEGTISRANAEAVQKRITEGKKVRDAEAGKLAQSIMMETNESFSEKSKEARTTEIARMLRAKGMSAADAQSMSETLDKAVMAGGIENLSKAEQRKINNNKAASSVYNKLAYNAKTQTKVNTKIDAATEAEQRVHNAVSSMFTRTQAMGAKYVGRNRATEDDLRKATGTEVKGPMGVIVLNADRFDNAKLTGVRRVNGQIKYTVEIDGKEQAVDASQIRARNIGTAAIIEKSTNDPHLYNMGYTNKLLQVMNTLAQQEQPDALMMDAYRMRMAAFKGQAMPKALINEKAAKELYDYSRIEYQAIRQEETKEANRNALKPGQGTATFAGYQFGTKEFDNALDSSNMSESEKEKIRVYAALSKAAGTQVAFRSIEEIQQMALTDEDMSIFKGEENKLYGAESKSGILINLGGENITTDPVTGEKKYSKHDIGVTYGHEFLHFLQRNSLKGYNDIVKYVFDTQAKNKGEAWVNQQLEKYMRDQDIDLNEAIFEFVADSCDSIFSSKEVIDHIVNTNQTLYGEIKSFIKDLFTRVRAALDNMRGSMSEAGAQMINTNYRALGKLVNVAWDEAASGQIITPEEYQQMVAEETNTQRFSRAETFEAAQEKYKGKDLINDETLYNYNFLVSMPNIKVQTEIKSNRYTDNKGNIDRTKLEKIAMDNAKFVGRELSKNRGIAVKNNYTGREIIITPDGAMHGTTYLSKSVIMRNARATARIGNLAKIAIPLNVMTNEKQQHNGTYAMAAPMVSMDGKHSSIAVLVVDELTGNVLNTEVYDQVHSVSVREKNEAGLEAGTASPSSQFLNGDTGVTRSNISIKELLDVVNSTHKGLLSRDVLRHFGEVKPDKGYWAENTRYSRAQLDNDYMAAVENGDMEAAQRMADFYAEQKGYTEDVYHGTSRFGFTEFDLVNSLGYIFASYDKSAAKGYAKNGNVRSVASAIGTPQQIRDSLNEMGTDDFVEAANALMEYQNINATVEPTEDGQFAVVRNKQGASDSVMSREKITEMLTKGPAYNGIYHMYARPGNNPLTIDAEGAEWDKITVPWSDAPVSTNDIAAYAKQNGFTSVRINNVDDHSTGTRVFNKEDRIGDIGIFFNQDDVKSADPVTYDDNGNVIPLSERFNDQKADIRWSRAQLDENYMAAVENGNTQRQQELVYEAGRKAGWAIKAYHGTQRGDRVGNEFRPDRATSGPMAFFTDNRGIAENYARDKRDTSIDYDPDYHEEGWEDYDWQFKVKDKNGKYVPVRTIWDNMNYSQKQKFIENAKHITTDDEGEIVYDEDTNDGLGNYDEYTLRDYKGNGIDALVYSWLKAGELLGDEETFIKVLEMAGIKDAKWFNPNESHEKVYDVLLNIQNPFDTSTMYTMDFLEELSDWYYGKQGHSVNEKPEGVTNMWDKKGTTVWNWIQYGWDDMRTGSTGNWTRIPDGVTDFLKYKGYDGIKDTGGKGGGETHTVWIPFSSEQVKSADPVTYDNDGNVIPLSERFDASKTDIRWSRAQTDIDPRQKELSEAWQKARDDADALREQVQAMKPEMDAWTDKLTKAMKNGTSDEMMAEYKEWEKGYVKLRDELYDAEQRYKDANRAYDDYIEERDVAEEQKKIKASGLSEADYRRKQAVEEFGYTTDFREAGYLLPNGKMLNFTGEKGKHYGTRGEDHRGIGRIYASRENQGGAAMFAFMKDGNIRVMAETPGIDLITTIEPTAEQYEQIRNMARRFAGEHFFNVDLTDEHGYTDDSIEYDGRVDPNKVVNDIKSYYKTGVVPTQSTVSQFHYSRWTESGMDVNYWMEHATPSMVQTEDERELISMYRGKRTSISLSLKKQGEYRARIRQLEAIENPSTDVKSELTALRNKLEIEKKKVYRLEEEILQITRNDGWAGMMYQHNMVFRDYVEGRTQEQVRQTIDDMLKLVEQTQEQVTKDTENLKKLATHQAVQTMKSFMGKTSMGKMASILRKTYNSTMNKAEIEDRLAEMALKQASGKDITSDTEALAHDLLDRMRGIRTDTLESLRGQTLVIGQSLAEELRKENSSIKELQSRIKGSGIKIVTGVKSSTGEIDKHSRISEQWSELREKNKALPDVENMAEIDKLHTIVDFIEGELRASTGAEQFGIDFDEVAAMVRASVGNITTYLVDDPKARAQINNLMKQIADLSKATEKTAADMQGLYGKLDDVMQAGARAKGIATAMERDVNEAIKYYNTTARVAAEKERTKVRKALIAQLRDETTQKLLKQQEKYRSMIENNQKARELAEDNAALRQKVSTVATRMANRIFAETDQKNVPEETKGLVRQVLDMISKFDAYSEDGEGFLRKVTYWDKQKVENVRLRLMKMMANYGQFDPETDLDWLVVKAADPADNDYTAQEAVIQDLINIEAGLLEYRNAEGQGRISLADRKAALEKVQEAISEIWDVIQARSELEIAGRKMQVYELAEVMRDEMQRSRFKGERTGFGTRARNTISGGVTWGNLTPEYFFKNLKNRAMEMLHRGLKDAENRSGLEAARAKARLAQIAEENGFAKWDGQEEHKVQTRSGEITMTTEQIMALYATWLRESNQMRPEDTAHLLHGGFVLAEKENKKGLPGREKRSTRPIRMSKANLDALGGYLTDEQKQYVQDMVAYMSGELAELGNEASMKMYGIKKFTEQFYFPIKSWGGVLNKRSDAGISSNNENRAAQQGFSKRIKNNAANAIEIGDFTPTAIKHVAGMITYNTVGPAIENMNKVLNQQLQYGNIEYTEAGEEEDNTYKMNLRAAFENAYGKQASDYLAKFMKDMNGGVTTERTPFDKLLSLFKKNAVAGSLSVAAQQPLSYIRAAMMINPKYLAAAINPIYWKGSYNEMMKHSGVAVIKEMGKFDMNFGQTMQEWITPEGMESKARKAWNKTTDLVTGLPGAMDMMTWTRMWTAVKLEQMAQNKGMDFQSDEFMAKVAERFNDLMRRTQVYDSVMTKSQNMRSTHFYAKTLTSFMAEPTLSLNVLADAFQNMKEKGGKAKAIKAVATFLLSAAAQAGAKAFFGAGRSPDKKKNKEENFLNKFWYNLLSEANPFGLIPGYRQIVETMTDGEFKDDTMGMIAKGADVVDRIWKLATGEIGQKGLYRDLEDSIGQMLQLTTDIPMKNIMRDFRAMVNWFSGGAAQGLTGDTYAQRPTSSAVLKYQLIDSLMSNDLAGLVNKKLDDEGYKTTNAAYYDRLYAATASGNTQAAEEIKDYLINGKGVSEKTIQTQLGTRINQDESLSGPEKVQQKLDNGASVSSVKSWITQNYKQAYIDADTDGRRQLMNELTKMYKLLGVSGDDAMKTVTKWVKDEKKKN